MSDVGLRVRQVGPGTTIQDGGRKGYLRFGVTAAGPMDPIALATANLALGRPRDSAAIEVSMSGIEVEAEGEALTLAIVSGVFEIRAGAERLPSMAVLQLEPGMRLVMRATDVGAWAYIAVAGRIDLAPALGSLSTHVRSGLGGLGGRGLAAGDLVPVAAEATGGLGPQAIHAPWLVHGSAPIRVVLGPQDDYFAADQIEAFLNREWHLSPRSDRMAYSLQGEPLRHAKGHDIVSDGIAHGAIQVPGSGLPFVLMADRQPTGGYPKIATVISADLGRLAQIQAGHVVRFRAVSWAEAVEARRQIEAQLAAGVTLMPLTRAVWPSAFLLERNLVSGVVDALHPPSA